MKRSGSTEKISISLDRNDLDLVRRRAKRVHQGNISKVIGEAIGYVRYAEGRDALIEALGDEGMLSPEEVEAIASEWSIPPAAPSKKRARRVA
jgi:hypothetical protein